MAIEGFERYKVEKTVKKIVEGNFDENTVDGLLMGLREHCASNSVFREIAHFVAHNKVRNQGLTNSELEAFYLSLRHFSEYVGPEKRLDFSVPVPMYIKKLLMVQLDKLTDAEIRKKYRERRKVLKSRIDKLFNFDEGKGTILLKEAVSNPTAKLITDLLSFIQARPVFTQQLVLDQIVSTLNINNLMFEMSDLVLQSDKIVLCILALLHNTTYETADKAISKCYISSEHDLIPLGPLVGLHGEAVVNSSFGKLSLKGTVPVNWRGRNNIWAAFSIFLTDLLVEDWCEPSMVKIVSVGSTSGLPTHVLKVDFDRPLFINDDFKLQPL
ncbi:hypothetical protein [Pseudomonas sp. 31 R 17]|nr:hypothetical protein [Pseudomonas sp. 31 R 17]